MYGRDLRGWGNATAGRCAVVGRNTAEGWRISETVGRKWLWGARVALFGFSVAGRREAGDGEAENDSLICSTKQTGSSPLGEVRERSMMISLGNSPV